MICIADAGITDEVAAIVMDWVSGAVLLKTREVGVQTNAYEDPGNVTWTVNGFSGARGTTTVKFWLLLTYIDVRYPCSVRVINPRTGIGVAVLLKTLEYSLEVERTPKILAMTKLPTAVPWRVTYALGEALVSVIVEGVATTEVEDMCDTVITSFARVGRDWSRTSTIRLLADAINNSLGGAVSATNLWGRTIVWKLAVVGK